jgi:hypothetical protein
MRKFILSITAVAAIASPIALATSANAAAPDGNYNNSLKEGVAGTWQGHDVTPENASLVGDYSARSTQNGQFVSGKSGTIDQTTTPGSRAALVQGYLGH